MTVNNCEFSPEFFAAVAPGVLLPPVIEFCTKFVRGPDRANLWYGAVLTGTIYQVIQTVAKHGIYLFPPSCALTHGFILGSSLGTSMTAANLFSEEDQDKISFKRQIQLWAPGVLTALCLFSNYGDYPLIPLAASVAMSTLYVLSENARLKEPRNERIAYRNPTP